MNRLIKRAFDVSLALPLVVFVLPPLCAWVWTMQRLQAPGPLFHVRERRGQHGEVFRMLKFRSMRVGPADDAAESRHADGIRKSSRVPYRLVQLPTSASTPSAVENSCVDGCSAVSTECLKVSTTVPLPVHPSMNMTF